MATLALSGRKKIEIIAGTVFIFMVAVLLYVTYEPKQVSYTASSTQPFIERTMEKVEKTQADKTNELIEKAKKEVQTEIDQLTKEIEQLNIEADTKQKRLEELQSISFPRESSSPERNSSR